MVTWNIVLSATARTSAQIQWRTTRRAVRGSHRSVGSQKKPSFFGEYETSMFLVCW